MNKEWFERLDCGPYWEPYVDSNGIPHFMRRHWTGGSYELGMPTIEVNTKAEARQQRYIIKQGEATL